MRGPSPLGIAVLGSGIIAVTYGLARFAFGRIAGSPVGGWLIAAHGHAAAFAVFAAFGLGGAGLSPRLPVPAASGACPAVRED